MAKEKATQSQEWEEVRETGEFAPWIDWDNTTEVIGKVTAIRDMNYNEQKKKVIEVETEQGTFSVGETGLLKFPKELTIGRTIRIINNGWIKLRSGRRGRDLKLYLKKEEPF